MHSEGVAESAIYGDDDCDGDGDDDDEPDGDNELKQGI